MRFIYVAKRAQDGAAGAAAADHVKCQWKAGISDDELAKLICKCLKYHYERGDDVMLYTADNVLAAVTENQLEFTDTEVPSSSSSSSKTYYLDPIESKLRPIGGCRLSFWTTVSHATRP